jgi:5-formyltetrahydrofolate cyclo-ligase
VTGDVQTRKEQLRADVLATRASMSEATRTAAGVAIARRGLAAWSGLATVAAYVSLGFEPSSRQLVDGLAAHGVHVLLPVVDGDVLDWAAYIGPAELTTGRLGITEPTGERLGPAALADADVVVVPALAVDRVGNRLGRGRGYYDRALLGVTARIVAVVYDAELLDQVPAEPHDRRVDAVLRPAGLSSSS